MKTPSQKILVQVRLALPIHKKLSKYATAEGLTMTAYVRRLLIRDANKAVVKW